MKGFLYERSVKVWHVLGIGSQWCMSATLFAMLIVVSQIACAQEVERDASQNGMQENILEAWKGYQERFDRMIQSVDATVTVKEIQSLPERKPLGDYSIRIVTDAGRSLVEVNRKYTPAKSALGQKAYAVNNKYAFSLDFPPDKGKPSLSRLEYPVGKDVERSLAMQIRNLSRASLVQLPMASLEELCLDSGFMVSGIQTAQDAPELIEIAFSMHQGDREDEVDRTKYWGLESGHLVLDSDHDFCLQKARLKVFLDGDWVDLGVETKGVVVHVNQRDMLIASQIIDVYSAGHYAGTSTFNFTISPNERPVQDSVFELTAFGLELPDFSVHHTRSWTFWLVVLNGIVLLLLGVFLIWRKVA